MSSAHRHMPHRVLIQDYKAQHHPYIKQPENVWRSNLDRLTHDLSEIKGTLWSLEPESLTHYVYVLMDPRHPGRWEYTLPSGRVVRFPYRPYYIGKGTGDRSSNHFKTSEKKKNPHKDSKIEAIIRAGFNPRDYVAHSKDALCSESRALAYEIDLIAGLGRDILTNKTDGGEGATGARMSAHTRQRMRDSNAARGHTVMLTFNGVTQSRRAWAKELGIKVSTIVKRMRSGYSMDQVLATGFRPLATRTTLSHHGHTLTVEEWSVKLGMSHDVIYKRLKANLPIDEVLKPKHEYELLELNGTKKTLSDWARHMGVSRPTISRRLRRGESLRSLFELYNVPMPGFAGRSGGWSGLR